MLLLGAVAAVKLFSACPSAREFLEMLKGGGAGTKVSKTIMDGAGVSKVPGGMKAFGGGFAAMMKGIVRGLRF